MAGARAGSAPPAPRGHGAAGPRRSLSAGGAAPPPRLRPLFLWVRQRDTAVLQVHCEDYDPRNRLRLTRTPHGWRVLPRTETFDAIRLPRAAPPPVRRPRRPRRSRPRRRRQRTIDRAPPAPPALPPVVSTPSPARPVDEEQEESGWNLPDIEISIPSHTIHVPQRSEPAVGVNSSTDFNPTPLDKLLAVAELEFNQQRSSSPDHTEEEPSPTVDSLHRQFSKFPFLSEDECEREIVSFDIDESTETENARHEQDFFSQKRPQSENKILDEESVFRGGLVAAKDLFESITESHYMPVDLDNHDHEAINANELLDSLVEKGCEDNNIIGNDFDKIAQIVNERDQIDGDYDEEDEEMLMDDAPVSDIIHRLEQSLDSPGQNSMTAAQGLLHLQRMTEELAEAHLQGNIDDNGDYININTFEKPEESVVECAENVIDCPNEVIDNIPILNEEKEDDIDENFDDERNLEEHINNVTNLENVHNEEQRQPELESETISEHVERESEGYSSGEPASDSDIIDTNNLTDNIRSTTEDDQAERNSNKDMQNSDKESDSREYEDDLMPTDLSINANPKEGRDTAQDVIDDNMSNKSDEMPKDLSCRKRAVSPYTSPQRVETPRPMSRGSDTIQSPQPSGIPAVPPSPELFPPPQSKSNSKSLFLETLLSSPSPKMCFSSELTITKHQNEPLNLGKSRKSASPTVSSCSEEVKKPRILGEPEEKRYRKEMPEEAPLQKLNKLFSKTNDSLTTENKQRKHDKPHRLEDPTPLEQLQLLRCSSEFEVPDPLLIPKERFSAILASPAREIPALLLQRPELRLPEAFAFPAVLQDPDILVVSLSQLEAILQKHRQSSDKEKTKEPKPSKPTTPNGISESRKSHSTPTPQGLPESPLRSLAVTGSGTDMAGDIDAATSAALGQMLWLPYLSQFEAAMACSQNADLLKALHSPVPPGFPSQGSAYPDLSQMFSPQSRFTSSVSPAFPTIPPLDYGNQLELAMWQEAMAHANGANLQRSLAKHSLADNNVFKNAEAQNLFAQAAKMQHYQHQHHQQMQQGRGHSARTSPITRGWRGGPPLPWAGYPARPPHPAPEYSPGARGRPHHHPLPPSPSPSASPSPYFQNNNYLGVSKQGQGQGHGQGGRGDHASSSTSGGSSGGGIVNKEQRPRITVKSLQNLLETPEVGSSTHPPEEPPHDPHTPLWHPLFGNQKNYSSPWNWTTVTVNGD